MWVPDPVASCSFQIHIFPEVYGDFRSLLWAWMKATLVLVRWQPSEHSHINTTICVCCSSGSPGHSSAGHPVPPGSALKQGGVPKVPLGNRAHSSPTCPPLFLCVSWMPIHQPDSSARKHAKPCTGGDPRGDGSLLSASRCQPPACSAVVRWWV